MSLSGDATDDKPSFYALSRDKAGCFAGALAIAEETARFRERGFDLTISDEAFEFLVRRGI
jgi:hypothetical protein